MWNWLVGSVGGLSEKVLKQESDAESDSGSNSYKAPPIVETSPENAPDRDADKSDSSEHELDSTETESKSQKRSPLLSKKLPVEDTTTSMPSLTLREATSSGFQALKGGFSNLLSDVTGVVKSNKLVSEFLTEEEKFALDKARVTSAQAEATPPWFEYNEAEEMKTQILEISSSRRNLLREPPPGSTFQFSLDQNFGQAMLMLVKDPKLDQVRFDLVPKKISEEAFWRNYFYRVHLVIQSVQLGTLKRDEKVTQVGADSSVGSPVATDEIEPEEFVSDALDIQSSDTQQLTQEELNQLKLSADPAGQEKLSEEIVFDDALDKELDNFNPDDVKDEDFDYADFDEMLKDTNT